MSRRAYLPIHASGDGCTGKGKTRRVGCEEDFSGSAKICSRKVSDWLPMKTFQFVHRVLPALKTDIVCSCEVHKNSPLHRRKRGEISYVNFCNAVCISCVNNCICNVVCTSCLNNLISIVIKPVRPPFLRASYFSFFSCLKYPRRSRAGVTT